MQHQKIVSKWLLTIMFSIILIIIIGGITRLTNSGLSIVEWRPITGILPPLSELAWENEFDKYKNYPEYKNNTSLDINELRSTYLE